MNNTPKIYVACLASYNAGTLHGEWIDLDGTEDIGKRIDDMLGNSPVREEAEEWAIHDHEFCGHLGTYAGFEGVENISEVYAKAKSQGVDWELFCEFCTHTGDDIELGAIEKFNESYAGSDKCLADWCRNFLDETGQLNAIPENLRFYFDYDAFAWNLEMSDVFTVRHAGQAHIFWNH